MGWSNCNITWLNRCQLSSLSLKVVIPSVRGDKEDKNSKSVIKRFASGTFSMKENILDNAIYQRIEIGQNTPGTGISHNFSSLSVYTKLFSKTRILHKHTSGSTCGHYMVIKPWKKSLMHLEHNLILTGYFISKWTSLGIQFPASWKGTVSVAAFMVAVDFIKGSQYSKVTDLRLSCHCALTVIADMCERSHDTLKTRSWIKQEISSIFSP